MLHTVSAETAAESARLPVFPKQMASNVKSSGVKLCRTSRACVSGRLCPCGCYIIMKLGKAEIRQDVNDSYC